MNIEFHEPNMLGYVEMEWEELRQKSMQNVAKGKEKERKVWKQRSLE